MPVGGGETVAVAYLIIPRLHLARGTDFNGGCSERWLPPSLPAENRPPSEDICPTFFPFSRKLAGNGRSYVGTFAGVTACAVSHM